MSLSIPTGSKDNSRLHVADSVFQWFKIDSFVLGILGSVLVLYLGIAAGLRITEFTCRRFLGNSNTKHQRGWPRKILSGRRSRRRVRADGEQVLMSAARGNVVTFRVKRQTKLRPPADFGGPERNLLGHPREVLLEGRISPDAFRVVE